ncbi:MAG: hypothetical protein IJ468_11310 [Lachnospiraceae bacterium]|nr:hypothetical protein [Lachnospiraceae bacterium]
MKEKLYTIPINDAFAIDCECPICAMRKVLENNAVEFTMGPSYMEDDIRMETDKMGFCAPHMQMLIDQNNKLGLALVLKTHIDKTNKEIDKRMKMPSAGGSLFKKAVSNPLLEYIDGLNHSCYICNRISNTFGRYLHTVVILWKTDEAFRKTYKECKGFCTEHLGDLLKEGEACLSKSQFEEFRKVTTELYLTNMKRMAEDLEWFVNKFDYRYKDEPWKNAKDAIPRAIIKTNGMIELEDEKKKEG